MKAITIKQPYASLIVDGVKDIENRTLQPNGLYCVLSAAFYQSNFKQLNIGTMDLNYLQNEILPKREQEIKDGKNLATRQPIYVVLDLQENFCSGHSDYESSTNYRGRGWENGYIDTSLDGEEREFCETDEGMKEPDEVTKFFTDRIIAFFLTSEAAHDYLKYQSHNLSDAYVYVFYSGYANHQMDKLLCNA